VHLLLRHADLEMGGQDWFPAKVPHLGAPTMHTSIFFPGQEAKLGAPSRNMSTATMVGSPGCPLPSSVSYATALPGSRGVRI
jgi:hypothetical protein